MTKEAQQKLLARPPIVVVMGHVDHGKTTLIDHIRKTNVAAKEAGEITQSIGAYEIETRHQGPGTGKMTIIDTPGHEAFRTMRSRGTEVADIAVLVVAADEGVKPQTLEAIKIIQEAEIHFIVALTKIDKPNANLDKVKNELTSSGVLLEGYGGRISYQPVSAKTGEGVNELLDLINLTAELENLTYDPRARAHGFILEAKLDSRRGIGVSVILTNGTVKRGQEIATVSAKGKIKILENFLGKAVGTLEPSSPARIIGFETLPKVGEEFLAGEGALTINQKGAQISTAKGNSGPMRSEEPKEALRIILKAADVGSLEALSALMKTVKSEKPLAILGESIGDVNDNDVKGAIASKAVIVGFKTKVVETARNLAEIHGVTILVSDIVYELIKTIEEFLKKPYEAAALGELLVLAIFSQKKPEKQVVGGRVIKGLIRNRAQFEILRGEENIGRGQILNIQEQKKDVNQVSEGSEAGLLINSAVLIESGDLLIVKK
ncbi:MAG: GTP-binding protein [Candidatus Liptonbacteria bacterium]|nr:GTP-binding protein [Candidatus Liptonbacteria bacterium]